MMYCGMNKGNKMYEDMMTHEQIQQMFSEESDDIADFSASYMRVRLQGGLFVQKLGVSYMRERLICKYIW